MVSGNIIIETEKESKLMLTEISKFKSFKFIIFNYFSDMLVNGILIKE
jgi:hypothetical protein